MAEGFGGWENNTIVALPPGFQINLFVTNNNNNNNNNNNGFDQRHEKEDSLHLENRENPGEESIQKKPHGGLQVQFKPAAIKEKLEYLPSMLEGLRSHDSVMQLKATTQFRELLSIEGNAPIKEVIQAGVVPHFVEFLSREDFPQLQLEAAWALTNIAYGNAKVVIDHGAVPLLVKLLGSSRDDVREQAVWALGNFAGDCHRWRDLVLGCGALHPLLKQLNERPKPSMLRIATWTLSNFCQGEPEPSFDQVKSALPTLAFLIDFNNGAVLTDACWALSYLSYGKNEKIQAVIQAGVCRRLVELLQHPSPLVLIPALRTVGNIVTGDDSQTQHIIDLKALPSILDLLTNNYEKRIKKDACWTISNIASGNKEQIQAVIGAEIIGPLVQLFQNAEFDVKKEVAWTISNAICGGTHEQIEYLVRKGCIKPLCDLLACSDPKTLTACLEGLENILKVGEVDKNSSSTGGQNVYATLIDNAEGWKKIENLRFHDKKAIYVQAAKIVGTYWSNSI